MVEQVENRKLFHVTATKPYKQAFVAGQRVAIGEAYNPYFGFCEDSHHRRVVLEDGRTVQLPAIKFFDEVKAGTIKSPKIAIIAAEVASHYIMLTRELIMEELRREEFNSEPPSRQRCLYACDTLEEAREWNQRIGENGAICELVCAGTLHRADARLLVTDTEPLSVTRDRGRKYWRGEASDNPAWEILFVGEAEVTGYCS
jgi:Protein of unknown function (DUF2441)